MAVKVVKIKSTNKLGLLMIKGKKGLDNILTEDERTVMLNNDEYEIIGEIDDKESR